MANRVDTLSPIQGQQGAGTVRHTLDQISLSEERIQILPIRLA